MGLSRYLFRHVKSVGECEKDKRADNKSRPFRLTVCTSHGAVCVRQSGYVPCKIAIYLFSSQSLRPMHCVDDKCHCPWCYGNILWFTIQEPVMVGLVHDRLAGRGSIQPRPAWLWWLFHTILQALLFQFGKFDSYVIIIYKTIFTARVPISILKILLFIW